MKPKKAARVVAQKVELWSVDDLVPYARNAKKHPQEQILQLAASIREFGFTVPVLAAEDGTIIAGHGRVLAAKEIGLTQVPVIVARDWTEEQRRAYTLADNRLSENGEWDEELLKIELGDLNVDGFNLDLLGFTGEELELALKAADLADGFEDEDEPTITGTTRLRVGPYTIPVANEKFHAWQAEVRAAVGDTRAAIEAEILERLGLN